jgi:hypothetical protein
MPFNLTPGGNSGLSNYHKISIGYGNYASFEGHFLKKNSVFGNVIVKYMK